MPVIKSAIKKLRKDRGRQAENDKFRSSLKTAIRIVKKQKSQAKLKKAISLIDKAAKKNIFHKNKAARMKSQLAKFIKTGGESKKATKKISKKRKATSTK